MSANLDSPGKRNGAYATVTACYNRGFRDAKAGRRRGGFYREKAKQDAYQQGYLDGRRQ